MSVAVGWSKDPNATVNWPGGPVSGIIAPDNRTRMRLVAASAPPGLETVAPPSLDSIANNHRSYAIQWFLFAGIAALIYVLALRTALEEGAGGVSAAMHRLANGLTVAVDPLPGAESVAMGLYAMVGSRSEPEHCSGLAHLVEHMVFKGAGARGHARARRGDRGCRRLHERLDLARPDDLPRPGAGPRHGAACGADRRPGPRAAFRRRASRAREGGHPFGDRRDPSIRPTTSSTIICSRRRSRTRRSADPSSAARRASARITRDDCLAWMSGELVPSRLILAASGKVDPDEVAETRRAAVRRHGGRAGNADRHRRIHRRPAQRPPRVRAGALVPGPAGPRAPPIRACPRWRCSCRRLAAGRRRACSRSCARSAGSLIRSEPGARRSPTPASSTIGCAADKARAVESMNLAREVLAETIETLTDAEVRRAQAQMEAGLTDGAGNAAGPRRPDGAIDRGVRPYRPARGAARRAARGRRCRRPRRPAPLCSTGGPPSHRSERGSRRSPDAA